MFIISSKSRQWSQLWEDLTLQRPLAPPGLSLPDWALKASTWTLIQRPVRHFLPYPLDF